MPIPLAVLARCREGSRAACIQKILQLLNLAQSGFVPVDHPSWMINPHPAYLQNLSVKLFPPWKYAPPSGSFLIG
jgi:hypothetical protein